MASRISQMRNVTQPQIQPQQQLNQSIETVRNMMQHLEGVPNAEAVLLQALQNNPNMQPILNIMQSNGSLRMVAQQMAQSYGINLQELIQKLLLK